MDKATEQYRTRLKAQRSKRGELSNYEPRGLGKKNKPAGTFPTATCSHVEGGKKVPIRRKRKDNTPYLVMILVGGVRCPQASTTTLSDGRKVCELHLRG